VDVTQDLRLEENDGVWLRRARVPNLALKIV
jgi:hypothetical protein